MIIFHILEEYLSKKQLMLIYKSKKMQSVTQRHITNGNCKMPCSGILGFVRLGHGFGIPTPHYTTFFAPVKRFAFSLSGAKKRQLPRTLDEIKILCKMPSV